MKTKKTYQIDYQFISFPYNFLQMGDGNTTRLLTLLIQKHNIYLNKLDKNGYFFLSNKEIEKYLHISSKTIRQTIEALYRADIISIISIGEAGKRETNKYKLNFDKILEITNLTLEESFLIDNRVMTVERGSELTYRKNVTKLFQNSIHEEEQEIEEDIPITENSIIHEENSIELVIDEEIEKQQKNNMKEEIEKQQKNNMKEEIEKVKASDIMNKYEKEYNKYMNLKNYISVGEHYRNISRLVQKVCAFDVENGNAADARIIILIMNENENLKQKCNENKCA